MRSFLGVVGFYRRFLPDAASKISSLTETLKKNAPNCIEWSESLETTFKGIKSEFVNSVCLHIPLPDHPFILQSDACDKGIGAVLLQSVDGVERPVTFISRKLNGAESRFSIIEKECLAIVYAVKKLHHYLYGQKFKIRTDHAPLQWLSDNKDVCSRRMRWSLALQPYSFVVEYVRGKDNIVADVLSRYPVS